MTPKEAGRKKNENKVWRNLYPVMGGKTVWRKVYPELGGTTLKPKFSRGNNVRITKKKNV